MKKAVAMFDELRHIIGRWDRDSIRGPRGARQKIRQAHLIFATGYGIISTATCERRKTMKDIIRKTAEFKALRAEAREAIAAFADGADFEFTLCRLADIGERMNIMLA